MTDNTDIPSAQIQRFTQSVETESVITFIILIMYPKSKECRINYSLLG